MTRRRRPAVLREQRQQLVECVDREVRSFVGVGPFEAASVDPHRAQTGTAAPLDVGDRAVANEVGLRRLNAELVAHRHEALAVRLVAAQVFAADDGVECQVVMRNVGVKVTAVSIRERRDRQSRIAQPLDRSARIGVQGRFPVRSGSVGCVTSATAGEFELREDRVASLDPLGPSVPECVSAGLRLVARRPQLGEEGEGVAAEVTIQRWPSGSANVPT
jgi:hypothetical protein